MDPTTREILNKTLFALWDKSRKVMNAGDYTEADKILDAALEIQIALGCPDGVLISRTRLQELLDKEKILAWIEKHGLKGAI